MKNLISYFLFGMLLCISPLLYARDIDQFMDFNFADDLQSEVSLPIRDIAPGKELRKAPGSEPARAEPICYIPGKKDIKIESLNGTITVDKLMYAIFSNDGSYVATLIGWADSNDYYPEIVIPDEVPFEDMMVPVTAVNNGAFIYGWGITGVKFGKNIRVIGESSFAYTAIESLTIPSNVMLIDYAAFSNLNLKTLEFEEATSVETKLTIGAYAFAYSELTEVEIPARLYAGNVGNDNSFTASGYKVNPFYGTKTLKKITINPAYKNVKRNYTLEIIDDAWCICPSNDENKQTGIIAFPTASTRKSFAVEGKAIVVFAGAMAYADNLESINLTATDEASDNYNIQCYDYCIAFPQSLTSFKLSANGRIGLRSTFCLNAPMLQEYQFSSGITNYAVEDGVVYRLGENKRRLDYYPAGKRDIEFNVPEDVREIYTYALYSNKYIKSLTLPTGLKTLGDFAFNNCQNLESINMSEGFIEQAGQATITNTAFLNNAPDGELILGKCLLAYKGEMPENYIISPAVQSAASAVLYNYPGLRSLTFPDNFPNIPDYFCQSCSALRHITWPLNLKSIGYAAFNGIGYDSEEALLPVMELPEGLETIKEYAFAQCRLFASLDLPSTIKYIDNNAFNTLNWFNPVIIRTSTPPKSSSGDENPIAVFNDPTVNQGILIIPIDALESEFRAIDAWNFVNIEHGNFSGLETMTSDEDGYVIDGAGIHSSDGSLMQLYRPDGSCVGCAPSFDALPRGIYILKTTSGAYKITI